MWTAGTARVTASGRPLALASVPAPCVATGASLQVVVVQRKVTAT